MTATEYTIEKMVHGGYGLSHNSEGRITLIRGGISGETVLARTYQKARKVAKAKVTRILNPSPDRVQPPCPHYTRCGGCDFQHISYPAQLQAKHDILKDLLLQNDHPQLRDAAETLLLPPLPAPGQLNYRQRIRLQVDDNEIVGFYKHRTHTCVPIATCFLAHPLINQCLRELTHTPSISRLLQHTGAIQVLFAPGNQAIILIFEFKRKPRPADIKTIESLAANSSVIDSVFISGNDFAMCGPFPESEKNSDNPLSFTLTPLPQLTTPLTLSWEVGGFCQVNLEQNRNLIQTVLDFSEIRESDSVLDLFCGMGNFSVPLAQTAQFVTGIEGQGSSIRSARSNSHLAGQKNTEFIKSPINHACNTLHNEGKTYDCIVLDPPRQGVPGLIRQLSGLCRKRLVYISCDPATLCRDLAQFLNNGLTIRKLQPIDMFPQTHHIETVSLLTKA